MAILALSEYRDEISFVNSPRIFQGADNDGTVDADLLTTSTGAAVNHAIGVHFDKAVWIDHAEFFCEVNEDTAADITARLGYATNGQTLAAAVSAAQWVNSAAVNLKTGMADATATALTMMGTPADAVRIPAGARLFISMGVTASATSATELKDFQVRNIRFREREM